MTRASLAKHPDDIAQMFDAVATRYDLLNDLLTGFQVRRWRRLTREALALSPGEKVLDLAGGTGTSAAQLPDVDVVVADLSVGMVREGRRRFPQVAFTAADALALPFADGVFDAVTISYGIRNVVHTGQALTEMARVTKPGGRLVVCEFSQPSWAPIRYCYHRGVLRLLPVLARPFTSSADAYNYLAESIRDWPDQLAFARQIAGAGWQEVAYRNIMGGVVALHKAVKA